MTKEIKHTSLPFIIDDITSTKFIYIRSADDKFIIDFPKNASSMRLAEFIVRACNEYYQLKARIVELETKYERN